MLFQNAPLKYDESSATDFENNYLVNGEVVCKVEDIFDGENKPIISNKKQAASALQAIVSKNSFKVSIDGQLVSPTNKKLGRLEQLLINDKPLLRGKRFSPLNALKYKFENGQLVDFEGEVLGSLSDIRNKEGLAVVGLE